MATYTFDPVPAWGQVGGFARFGSKPSSTFPCKKTDGTDATVVQGGTTKVGYVESDATGLIPAFTTTDIPTVRVDFGLGVLTVHSIEAITAGAASAAAAASSATAAAGSATSASTSATNAATSASDAASYAGVINVKKGPYNAPTNGTDASSAINSAITANPGRTIFLPSGTYSVDAVAAGIKLNQAGTRLLLDPGAVVQVMTNNATAYMAVEVTAADCSMAGGLLLGDGPAHTGTTGEWGHLMVVQGTAHRFRAFGVQVKNAWGDGIAIQGNPSDVSILDCVADDNRRQGLSIISATRPRVIGGVYKNTGVTKYTGPAAGIDIEPNPSSGLDVIDAVLIGVVTSGNKGAGIQVVRATGQTTSAQVSDCRSIGDGTAIVSSYLFTGAGGTLTAKVSGCLAKGGTNHGFQVDSPGVELSDCTARANKHGFQLNAETKLFAPLSDSNLQVGIQFNAGSDRSTLTGGESVGNSQQTNGGFNQVDVMDNVAGVEVAGHISRTGTAANKPARGFNVRTGATPRLLGCDTEGTFTAAAYNNSGSAVAFPVPGVAKQTLAAAGTDAATTQTLANSLRTALINLGYGA